MSFKSRANEMEADAIADQMVLDAQMSGSLEMLKDFCLKLLSRIESIQRKKLSGHSLAPTKG